MDNQQQTSLLANKGFLKEITFLVLFFSQLFTLFAAPRKHEKEVYLTAEQQKSASYLDFLSMPCPGESFSAINKVSRPNWTFFEQERTLPVTTNRAQLALIVGVLTTNGYIAIESQNGQQVKNIGRDIMLMSKALGVSQTILSRGNNLIGFADDNQWESLRDELEATENEIKITMVEQQDHNLITLTSAAAWLRGLEVASTIVLNNYSETGAALLYEPDLARHLASELNILPERLRNDPLVIKIKDALTNIATLLEKEHQGLTKKTLENIKKETTDAITAIGILPSPHEVSPMPTASVEQEKK